ncbi:MAG TPA: UvrD-helicase domain-containing protein [Polyangiaceae bacterium]|nr:UvrD-helicase domain-containing protein [Polyangiaceae bacterium]
MSSTLNPSQEAAVEHDLGPMLVLAGAGSGKTRVVTMRIARLLERGVSARNILAMTFTNKAAGEMAERVTKLVGAKAAKDLTAGTFHRFGLDVLRAEARALGLRGGKFTVFDQADCSGVVREVLREVKAGKGFDVGAIVARISAAKNAFIEPEAYAASLAQSGLEPSEYDEITGLVYPKYVSMMRGFYAFDFDDLICEVVTLFKKRPEILEKYRMRFRYLIVDEYQDTNHAQLELVLALGGGHKNVCVVGDDDQSIYAWRGADVRNILEFERYFEGAKIVKLEHNYRSSEAVLKIAAVVLEKSVARRHEKTIVSTRPGGEPVEHVVCVDSEAEAKFVARTIDDLVRTGKARPKDCAILYRSNLQAPEIETALKERQVPYDMIGGQQLFERKEVKDLLSYLKVVFDPMDEIALRRIVNYPARGIGEVALDKIAAHATAYKTTLWTALTRAHAVQDLSPAAMEGARELVRTVEGARASFGAGKLSAEVARELCAAIKLKEDITAASSSNAAAARRWQNVEGMLGLFARRDERGLGTRDVFEDFLRLLALRQDGDEDKTGDVVTMSTMHGAKGLEFPVVFIVGLEEGLMPHARTESERVTDVPVGEHGVDEERRLFYVSVTRAKDKLYLCRAGRRAFRGKSMSRMPSRYVLEIPQELYTLREESGEDPQAAVVQRAGAQNLLAALAALGPPK